MDDARPARPGACAVLVLAAGGSARMGRPKQLIEVGGITLVARAAQAALGSCARPVAVVLGAHAEEVEKALSALAVKTIRNPDWTSGMASSIRMGIDALFPEGGPPGSLLIMPADQPALTSALLDRLIERHRHTGRITAAGYAGRKGAPAVFGCEHVSALRALTGDEGARALLNAGTAIVETLDMPELAVDLDTPADLERWTGCARRGNAPPGADESS